MFINAAKQRAHSNCFVASVAVFLEDGYHTINGGLTTYFFFLSISLSTLTIPSVPLFSIKDTTHLGLTVVNCTRVCISSSSDILLLLIFSKYISKLSLPSIGRVGSDDGGEGIGVVVLLLRETVVVVEEEVDAEDGDENPDPEGVINDVLPIDTETEAVEDEPLETVRLFASLLEIVNTLNLFCNQH